jgi:hypothetical protein
MKRIALAILLVVACSGSHKKSGGATGSGEMYAKKLVVTWGITAKGTSAEVFLQTTDETGKQTSYPLGTYEGECKVIKPAEDMKAITGVNCTAGNKGTELHAVVTNTEIIVLKMPVEVGVTPDPMSRIEVTRVRAPGGAAIEAGA